jgi:adenylate cyclase
MVANHPEIREEEAMDFAAAGLLDGLEGREHDARLELLQLLSRDGATLDELTVAVREDRLALLVLERRLGGRHTARELERTTGVPAAVMLRLRRLLGMPEASEDDRVFSDDDIQQVLATREFLDAGFELDRLAELTRVLGESMSRLAAAVAAVFIETFLEAGDNELQVAERFDALAQRLMPAMAPVLVASFNAHLRETIHRGRLLAVERATGQPEGSVQVAACFVDMVGFTMLGGELEVRELGLVAGRLAELATEHSTPPVRLVKTIGDAVMLVSADPARLVTSTLALVLAAEAEELPSLRAGIAFGAAVQRSGDLYGHTINLASRVTGVARPGSVLCTEQVRDAAADAFEWSYAGRFRLKGISDPVPLHRARPLPPPGRFAPAQGESPDAEAVTSRPSTGRRRRRARR